MEQPRCSGRGQVVDRVTLGIDAGETLGLVGESGSGKTTLVKVAVGLLRPTSGIVTVDPGQPERSRRRQSGWGRAGFRQLVGQNPRFALNPQLRIWRSVAEPLLITGASRKQARRAAADLLEAVGLSGDYADRYPHELSGGQLQRAAIARVLTVRPGLVVFDEAVSALDVSVQVQAINLIKDLQNQLGFAALFVSHDLAAVRYAADRIAVLYRSQLMLVAAASAFYGRLHHPYGIALQAAINQNDEGHCVTLDEPASVGGPTQDRAAQNLSAGCPLAPRCPFAVSRCITEQPALIEVDGQWSACHRAAELRDAPHLNPLLTLRPTQTR